jgi:LPXTG-motif cell wall-anchored protein
VYAADGDTTTTTTTTSGSTGETGSTEENTTGETGSTEENTTGETGSTEENTTGETGSTEENTTGETGSTEENTTGETGSTEENTTGETSGEDDTEGDEDTTGEDDTEGDEDGEEAELCVDEDGNDITDLSADLKSGLSGLPETVVAGSGWTKFSFNVSNNGDDEIKDIAPLIGVAAFGWDDAEDYSGEISVQVFDKATGTWQEVAGAAGEGGTFTPFSLGAGKSTSYELRLNVSGKVPDSIGLTGGFARYSDDDGCWIADDPNGWLYFFDILEAGSNAGKPSEAKPQTGGKKEITQAKTVNVSGELAETGSSSNLPVIGTIGGIAIVAGAGVVFAMKRRKSEGAAA